MDLTQIKITDSKDQLIKSSKSNPKSKTTSTTKNKGGRPKLDDELKRKNKVILYFTDEEIAGLKERCGKKPLSYWIRDKILSSGTRF